MFFYTKISLCVFNLGLSAMGHSIPTLTTAKTFNGLATNNSIDTPASIAENFTSLPKNISTHSPSTISPPHLVNSTSANSLSNDISTNLPSTISITPLGINTIPSSLATSLNSACFAFYNQTYGCVSTTSTRNCTTKKTSMPIQLVSCIIKHDILVWFLWKP